MAVSGDDFEHVDENQPGVVGPRDMARSSSLPMEVNEVTVQLGDFAPDDWHDIYRFFTEIVDAGETYAYPENLDFDQARRYWVPLPPGRAVIACEGACVIGTAVMGPNRPGRGSHIATASFMVDLAHQGQGIGRALGNEMVRWARGQGYRGVQFNAVVETNAAAVHLWQSLGFRALATVPGAFDHRRHGLVGLHVMYLPLTAAPWVQRLSRCNGPAPNCVVEPWGGVVEEGPLESSQEPGGGGLQSLSDTWSSAGVVPCPGGLKGPREILGLSCRTRPCRSWTW